MNLRGRMTDPDAIARYVSAGRATLTLRSAVTGTHYTVRVRRPRMNPGTVHFVDLLVGPDNERDFEFVGTLGPAGYRASARRKVSPPKVDAALDYFARALSARALPPALEVWHEGTCGRCGRKLTRPESISTGLGPECAEKK